jgi:hypothetical protein
MVPQGTRVRSLSGRLYRPWGFSECQPLSILSPTPLASPTRTPTPLSSTTTRLTPSLRPNSPSRAPSETPCANSLTLLRACRRRKCYAAPVHARDGGPVHCGGGVSISLMALVCSRARRGACPNWGGVGISPGRVIACRCKVLAGGCHEAKRRPRPRRLGRRGGRAACVSSSAAATKWIIVPGHARRHCHAIRGDMGAGGQSRAAGQVPAQACTGSEAIVAGRLARGWRAAGRKALNGGRGLKLVRAARRRGAPATRS